MRYYTIDLKKQRVHRSDCNRLTNSEHKNLGQFPTCFHAMQSAKSLMPEGKGCEYCIPMCSCSQIKKNAERFVGHQIS